MVFACLVGLKAHSTPLVGFSRTCVGHALITHVSNDNDNYTHNHSTQAWQAQRRLLVEGRHIGRRLLDNCLSNGLPHFICGTEKTMAWTMA